MRSREPGAAPAGTCVPTVCEDSHGRRRVSVGDTTLLIYQVSDGAAPARRAAAFYTPYRNPTLSPFFEASIIADLLAAGHHRAADYFGVFSWKFASKIPLGARAILTRLQRDDFSADVYSFFGRIIERDVWPLAERKHPGILHAATLLIERLGIAVDLSALEAPIIYQNHFLCRSSLYERFGEELLRPAMAAMADTTDTELQGALQQDSLYRDPRLTPSRTMALFSRPYLCLHPFICERLFSTWLAFNPDVRVRHVWRGRFVAAHNIVHEPEMRDVTLPT